MAHICSFVADYFSIYFFATENLVCHSMLRFIWSFQFFYVHIDPPFVYQVWFNCHKIQFFHSAYFHYPVMKSAVVIFFSIFHLFCWKKKNLFIMHWFWLELELKVSSKSPSKVSNKYFWFFKLFSFHCVAQVLV